MSGVAFADDFDDEFDAWLADSNARSRVKHDLQYPTGTPHTTVVIKDDRGRIKETREVYEPEDKGGQLEW